jgi:hypothetical protein
MTLPEIAFALMAGITASGVAGAVMELVAARAPSFSAPFVSRGHPLRSLLAAACAGPVMLANDAIAARRDGAISSVYLAFCGLTALVWAGALGFTVVGLCVHMLAEV